MALNQTQQKAVLHVGGPAMILAGPGSGKTTVITHRIYNLIQAAHVDEKKILVITFTKMAAKEMKDRFLKLLDKQHTEVVFGTFHAVFFMILKDVYHYTAEDIIKSEEQWRFIKSQLSFHAVQVLDETSLVADILSEISKVKARKMNYMDYSAASCDKNLFRCIYSEYQTMLEKEHRIDFEDMMQATLDLFENRADILYYWQNRFEYLLIDEFQDAAPVQFQIVRLLVNIHKNIFVVGDDDQSIYGFRGAAPSIMKAFARTYPEAVIYHLDINYRSNRYIVERATQLINHNKDRFYKDLQAFHQYSAKIEIQGFDDTAGQKQYILGIIHQMKNIAILTRTNHAAADIIRLLEHQGVIVQSAAHGKDFEYLSGHWITLDIAAYMKIANGNKERNNYFRILNKPYRAISRSYFIRPMVDFEELTIRLAQSGQKEQLKTVCQFQNEIKLLKNMTPFAGINYIRKGIGYEHFIQNYCKEQNICNKTLIHILDRLQESARQMSSYKEWLQYIAAGENPHKMKTTLQNDSEYNVHVCTMHSCKGLEFDNVIIMDANEGIMPYSKADTEEEIEEERRLFYVAVTRAKQRLFICYPQKRYNRTLQPSRFLKELYN